VAGLPKKFDRLHGRVSGRGKTTVVLGHGFGCDQTAWAALLPWFEDRFRVVTFDYPGSGPEGERSYDFRRHGSLFGYADDLLEILDEVAGENCVYVGHSVGCMIGAAASIARHRALSNMVMIAGSPCYLNHEDYQGGFEQAELNGLYDGMATNFQAWAAGFVPQVVGVPDHAVVDEFSRMLFLMRPDIALATARVIFQSDMRAILPRLECQAHILQPKKDIAVPMAVAKWMQSRMADATLDLMECQGHVPHITAPAAIIDLLEKRLNPMLAAA
jgi:sigma-B regulation protein RsbQ